MRPGQLAAVSLVAAVLGGVLVLAVAKAAGWLHQGGDTTTVVRVPASVGAATPVVVAKPLAGNGFAPAQIYRARAAGVVTISGCSGQRDRPMRAPASAPGSSSGETGRS